MDHQRLHPGEGSHTLLSTVPLPASRQCRSGPENRKGWAFSCRSSEPGPNKRPRIWKWSARRARANIRKLCARAPPGCSARRSCACAGTRWRSWCRSWWWWRMRPCSRWKTPRPCWRMENTVNNWTRPTSKFHVDMSPQYWCLQGYCLLLLPPSQACWATCETRYRNQPSLYCSPPLMPPKKVKNCLVPKKEFSAYCKGVKYYPLMQFQSGPYQGFGHQSLILQ